MGQMILGQSCELIIITEKKRNVVFTNSAC